MFKKILDFLGISTNQRRDYMHRVRMQLEPPQVILQRNNSVHVNPFLRKADPNTSGDTNKGVL